MIPITTLVRQNQLIGKELQSTISKVIKSGNYILGSCVAEFEKAFAFYLGVKYATGVASGTDAISLALLALGIGAGDEVIIPANSYPSVFALTQIGVIPKLVDIDPITYTINPDKIPDVITKKTKAILPVHMYGQPAKMEAILLVGKKYGIPVVEDCAQAHGAEIKIRNPKSEIRNYKVGSLGNLGCFSFYPTKNLGCLGDGGMVVTNNKELAEKVRLLRMYGEKGRYNSVLLGRNSRLDEIQAAILLVKLKYLDEWNSKRRRIANKYIAQLLNRSISNNRFNNGAMKQCNNLQLPMEAQYVNHIYHLFVIRTKKRNELKNYLESKEIMTGIHYPTPIHLVPSMKYLGYRKGDFHQSERVCLEVLSLPMFPELEIKEVEIITGEIIRFCDK